MNRYTVCSLDDEIRTNEYLRNTSQINRRIDNLIATDDRINIRIDNMYNSLSKNIEISFEHMLQNDEIIKKSFDNIKNENLSKFKTECDNVQNKHLNNIAEYQTKIDDHIKNKDITQKQIDIIKEECHTQIKINNDNITRKYNMQYVLMQNARYYTYCATFGVLVTCAVSVVQAFNKK